MEYDSDGIPVGTRQYGEKAVVEALPAIDHSKLVYPPFRKAFYSESTALAALSDTEVNQYRNELEIHVTGSGIPRPLQSFTQAGLEPKLLKEIARRGFEAPTPIQAQALPILLQGRDLIGLAKTGSGKTLSFLWPMMVHILDQPQMQECDGPIGLVLAPTRELAHQIYIEANKFGKVYNIRSCAIFGGEGKWQMAKALKEAPVSLPICISMYLPMYSCIYILILAFFFYHSVFPNRDCDYDCYRQNEDNILYYAIYYTNDAFVSYTYTYTPQEIVIATPGRLMDLLVSGATNLRRCTMVVIDGAIIFDQCLSLCVFICHV